MKKNKKCSICNTIKSLEYFHKDKTTNDNHTSRCIVCTKLYYKNYYYKKNTKKSKFPYKSIKDPQYIKDRDDFVRISGNGWWCDIIERRGRRPLAGKPKKRSI